MKAKKMWLCRDGGGDYVVCPLLRVRPYKDGADLWFQRDRTGQHVGIDIIGGHKIFGHLKLKPGEGPRKIEITVKFVD